MISPCQEGKSSPDALRRSACIKFLGLQLAFAPLGGGSSSIENQTSICCLSPEGPAQKIELVVRCQSRNNSMGASGAYAPSPSRQLTRPGRQRAEEILLIFSAPCYAAVRFSLCTGRNSFWRRSTATR